MKKPTENALDSLYSLTEGPEEAHRSEIFSELANASGIGWFYWSPHTEQLTCSPAVLSFAGFSGDSPLKISAKDLLQKVYADDRSFVDAAFTALLSNPVLTPLCFRMLNSAGDVLSVQIRGHFSDVSGSRLFYGVMQEVTAKNNPEQDLSTNFHIFSLMDEALMVLDSELNIKFINKKARHIFFSNELKIEGQNLQNHFSLFSEKNLIDTLKYSAENKCGGTAEHYFTEVNSWLEFRIVWANNFIIVFIKDISLQKRMELELRDQNHTLQSLLHSKNRLISIISHDFRGPITTISNLSGALFKQLQNKKMPVEADLASRVEKKALNFKRVLEGLFTWARSLNNSLAPNMVPIKMADIVDDLLAYFKEDFRKKGITPQLHFTERVTVISDEVFLRTVLHNLISNALKFSHPGGDIKISAQRKAGEALVIIEDKGIGIPKEKLNQYFHTDTFLPQSGTLGEKGMGLGLIIARDFVKMINGKMEFESTEGAGTSVSLTLPLSL